MHFHDYRGYFDIIRYGYILLNICPVISLSSVHVLNCPHPLRMFLSVITGLAQWLCGKDAYYTTQRLVPRTHSWMSAPGPLCTRNGFQLSIFMGFLTAQKGGSLILLPLLGFFSSHWFVLSNFSVIFFFFYLILYFVRLKKNE